MAGDRLDLIHEDKTMYYGVMVMAGNGNAGWRRVDGGGWSFELEGRGVRGLRCDGAGWCDQVKKVRSRGARGCTRVHARTVLVTLSVA